MKWVTNFSGGLEMIDVEKKEIGKAKVGLMVCVILVVILAVSNVWFYTNLQNQINTLQYQIDTYHPQQYFFFNDGDLLISEDCETHYWEIGLNPNNEQTYGYISNGLAYLGLNESGGSEWGWASFSQGDCPRRVYPDMLRGYCYDTAQPIPYSEGVEFTRKHIPQEGKYFLTAKVYLDEREYVHDVEDDDPKCNIGIVFYCSYKVNGVELPYFGEYDGNDNNFTAIDIYLLSSFWNGSTFEPINYAHMRNRTNGYTIGLTVSNRLQDEDIWKEYKIDMNWVLTQTFQSLPDNIDSLKIRATQFYVEGSGTLISARFDYLKMELR